MPSCELVQVSPQVELCVQAFGRRDGPAVLLIGGASRSMDWWDIGFCEQLAEATGGLVIRYDHRDTGESTWYPPGHPEYTFADLAADAIAILDALGLARAHLVGLSMGGQLAQVAALRSPGRVASLTLIATSPEPRAPDLPPTTGPLQAHYDTAVPPDWTDHAAVIDYVVAQDRAYAAAWPEQEEAVTRERAAAVADRTACVQASHTNHYAMRGHARWRDRLGTLRMPALVLHGTRDPLFTIEHGIALAAEIPGARLLRLPGIGHELPRRCWDTVIPAIAAHITDSTKRMDHR
ncbi:alpha/beta fold hydrolase [Nonomuraea sp. JJY05]|uniref:alpha/beta fold hydrolase n=1 Tax=Nonomuraea sp. JJY05 TaxID=3350255 RepID=UPI00373F2FBF